MNITKKSSRFPTKKMTLSIILASLALGAGVFAFWFLHHSDTNQQATREADNTSTVKQNQVVDGNKSTTNTPQLPSKGTGDNSTVSEEKKNDTSTYTNPEVPTITRAGQSGNEIKVVATFQKISTGYCELKLMNANSNSQSYESNITIGPAYYVCSFSIPQSKLGSLGTWKAMVVHHIGSATSNSETLSFEVK